MSRISIPIEALTSRFNLGDRFSGLRSQSVASRFANLKPIGEFFDFKRLSKPRDFSDVQARVNYNLAYFSSNYAVLFVMLSIYSLLTNAWLLFDVIFVSVGMWVIGKMNGQDLEIGTFRATTSQMYTGLVCIGIPVAIIGGITGAALWLIGAAGVTILGGRPRTPSSVPQWGRPPGVRLTGGRDSRSQDQSWEIDPRIEEIEQSDYSVFDGVILDNKRGKERFVSDELQFDGIDATALRKRRSGGLREGDPAYSVAESDLHTSGRKVDVEDIIRIKDEGLVEKALERATRARALGKSNVNLSQEEIDALERLEARTHQQKQHRNSISSPSTPKSKKSISPGRKNSVSDDPHRMHHVDRAVEGSPRLRASHPRARGLSSGSTHSSRDGNAPSHSRTPMPDAYAYPPSISGYPPEYYSSPYPISRPASNSSLRQMQIMPRYQDPYYHPRYYGYPEDYDMRLPPRPRQHHSDPLEVDMVPRVRSNSNMIAYPLDQVPNRSQTSKAPRFDPLDPRYGSPQRRAAPSTAVSTRHRLSHADDAYEEVDTQDSTSSETGSDSSGEMVQVRVRSEPSSGPVTRARASSAASKSGHRSGGSKHSPPRTKPRKSSH